MNLRALRQLAKYTTVSLAVMAADLAIVFSLVEYGGWHYLPAVTFGLAVTSAASFKANGEWTYRKKVPAARGYATTAAIAAGTALFILGATALLVHFAALPYLAARAGAGVVAGILGYLLDSKLTFHAAVLFTRR